MTDLFIHCHPPRSTAQGSLEILGRGTKKFIGKKSNSNSAKAIEFLTTIYKKHVPPEPLSGPLDVTIFWIYPYQSKHSKKDRLQEFIFCDTRPDEDNIKKSYYDILTKLNYWNDDSQVCCSKFIKAYGQNPGIYLSIKRADELQFDIVAAQIDGADQKWEM